MGTTKKSIKSQSLFLHSLEKTGGKRKRKKTESNKVDPILSKKSKTTKIRVPTASYNFSRDELFKDYHKTIEYRDLGKTLINKQKEPQQWLLKSTETGDFPGGKTLFGKKPKATYEKSSKPRLPLSPTTNQKIPDYQGQIDHTASIKRIRKYIETHKILATDDQLKKIFTSEQITQYLSAEENIAKGAKELHQYTKKAGWGTEGDPQLHDPKGQAVRYSDAMLEVAKILGTTDKGGMSRHEAQAYAEITGKAADPAHKAHYGSKGTVPVFPPRNLTGFNAYKDHPDTAKPTKPAKPDRFMPHIGPDPPMDMPQDTSSVLPIQDMGSERKETLPIGAMREVPFYPPLPSAKQLKLQNIKDAAKQKIQKAVQSALKTKSVTKTVKRTEPYSTETTTGKLKATSTTRPQAKSIITSPPKIVKKKKKKDNSILAKIGKMFGPSSGKYRVGGWGEPEEYGFGRTSWDKKFKSKGNKLPFPDFR